VCCLRQTSYGYSYGVPHMRTVQMTLDEDLIARLDRTTRRLKTTRSAFARKALREALERLHTSNLEKRHREGYQAKPSRRGEFDAWESEQVWGDT